MWYQKNAYYHTKKVSTEGGLYDSKFEAAKAQELELLKKAGEIKGFDAHLRIPLIVNGYTVCDYYVDFAVYHNDDTTEFIECKGYPTSVFKLKWKLFCALYEDDPNTKITLELQRGSYKPRLRKVRK
jgi:hypothetical protein